MPWKPSEASEHTHRANTPKRRKMWRDVANSILKRTGDDARAIRGANSVVKKSQSRRTRKRS